MCLLVRLFIKKLKLENLKVFKIVKRKKIRMADVREERIYCAEQIEVPYDLPSVLKHYSKEVIRANPENILEFSAKYTITQWIVLIDN